MALSDNPEDLEPKGHGCNTVTYNYECPNCGTDWTEDQLVDALNANEDWIILVQSCGYCPDCYPGELI